MRHRSLTNSRPHENIPLRAEYSEENAYCEIADLLNASGDPDWERMRRNNRLGGLELNHIFSVNMRPDYWWNVIVTSSLAHAWFHKRLTDGRILCVRAKIIKGEVDLPEFRRVFGKCLRGWLETNKGSSRYFEQRRAECLELIF